MSDDQAQQGAAEAPADATSDEEAEEASFAQAVPAGVETVTHVAGTGTVEAPPPDAEGIGDSSLARRYARREMTTGHFVAALAGRSVEAPGDLTRAGYTLIKRIGEGAR